MRLARIKLKEKILWAQLQGEWVYPLTDAPYEQIKKEGSRYPLSSVTLLCPCTPTKVVAAGLNYHDHIIEMHDQIPKDLVFFIIPETAVIGPEAAIIMPHMSKQVDYEAELAVVIKKEMRHVPPEAAMDYVLGFTCLNDVTARDLQKIDGQWTRAKGFDTFCPIGPWIETELDYQNTPLCTRLNQKVVQSGNTAQMIHTIPRLLSFISQVMTLRQGDVVATGTPSGIGPMADGDIVEICIEGIGVLRNTVVKER